MELKINFKGAAEIEIDDRYIEVEMHHGSPLLQKISFLYPVVNSIDLSTDFWKRDTLFMMSLGLKIGEGKKENIRLDL